MTQDVYLGRKAANPEAAEVLDRLLRRADGETTGKAWPPHPLRIGTPPLTWGLVGRRDSNPEPMDFAQTLPTSLRGALYWLD